MKKVLIFLLLILVIASCKKNAATPATVHQSEEMLGQYLFGPLSIHLPGEMSPTDFLVKFFYF
jgi:hypothetical protein